MSSMGEGGVDAKFRIGVAVAEKKERGLALLQPSLVEAARCRGILLSRIDPSLALSSQGPFHAILHKLPAHSYPFWTSHLLDFSLAHPHLLIVDPPASIHRLSNRLSMLHAVSELRLPHHFPTVSTPAQFLFDAATQLDAMASLKFPVIAKPFLVDGSTKSHVMSLVFNAQSLAKLQPPVVLQEFINHGGILFKAYVMGDYVQCVRRRSLPDVDEEQLKHAQGPISFSEISNTPSSADLDLPEDELPPSNFISNVACGLRKALGLRLFNFDIIRDVKTGNDCYHIIDINYFPGYAKMPDYESAMMDFFQSLVHERSSAADSNAFSS